MCWSGEASVVLASIGLSTTCYLAYKKESSSLYLPLGYFSLMEMLQAFTYTVINQCHLPLNQILTVLGYLHIVFQPFFVNMVSLHFMPQNISRKIAPFAYCCCFLASIIMLLKLYPFVWAKTCDIAVEPVCGSVLCSYSGNWHIAWNLPLNNLPMAITVYCIVCFIMPFLYGSWRVTLGHLTSGPLVAVFLNTQKNEWPAVWCLLSIGLILTIAKTPIRKYLYVQSWPLWRIIKS